MVLNLEQTDEITKLSVPLHKVSYITGYHLYMLIYSILFYFYFMLFYLESRIATNEDVYFTTLWLELVSYGGRRTSPRISP